MGVCPGRGPGAATVVFVGVPGGDPSVGPDPRRVRSQGSARPATSSRNGESSRAELRPRTSLRGVGESDLVRSPRESLLLS